MRKVIGLKLAIALFLVMSLGTGTVMAQENMIENGDLETVTPAFWYMDQTGGNLVWDGTQGAQESAHSLKIEKTATDMPASWRSINQANTYWNNVVDVTYSIGCTYKTDGVNTNPADDNARIGLKFIFYANGSPIIDDQYLWIDQTSGTMDWTELTSAVILTSEPDSVVCWAMMGAQATGNVWFDNFVLDSVPWTAGFFGADCEYPDGWMGWSAEGGGIATVVEYEDAHSGSYCAKLMEEDDADDEMTVYSFPVSAEPNRTYFISFWAKAVSIDTDDRWASTTPLLIRRDERAGITFFFHEGDWQHNWGNLADQFIYIDQRNVTNEWQQYTAVVTSPENTTGFSIRARFTSFVQGEVYFDDFECYEVTFEDNILPNGDLEDYQPNFWSIDQTGGDLTWATDEAHNGSMHSLKIEKTNTGTPASWISINNADIYWNNVGEQTYTIGCSYKTDNVNLNPATDDAKIGLKFIFYANGSPVIDDQYLWIDQTSATLDWTELTSAVILTAEPDSVVCWAMMGSDATGTVWFDDFVLDSVPWTAGLFGADCEYPIGWMGWNAIPGGFAYMVEYDEAHSGDYAVMLYEEDDADDEMVFYSDPVALDANEWYEFSVWIKTVNITPVDTNYFPSNVTLDRINERAGITFFFHESGWETGWMNMADQFVYAQQIESMEDWTLYKAVALAPMTADAASIRARFTSFPQGEVYYDDFCIRKMTGAPTVSVPEGNIVRNEIPTTISLGQNYPNPFNSTTTINFNLPKTGFVNLQVYDVLGRKVTELVNGVMTAGNHQVSFSTSNGLNLSSGLYFYRLSTQNQSVTRKMIYMK